MLLRLGRADESLDHVRHADRMSQGQGFSAAWVTVKQLLARTLHAVGRSTEAIEVCGEAIDRIEEHRHELNAELAAALRSSILEPLASTVQAVGEPRQAAGLFSQARLGYGELGPGLQRARLALREAAAWREAGEHERARECLQLTLALCTDATTRSLREQALAELAEAGDMNNA